jgi:hypothetical protein
MRIFENIPHKIETVVIDEYGFYVSGLTINYEVRKCSDNNLVTSGVMSGSGVIYTAEVTFTEAGEYRVKYITPTGYEKGFENIVVDSYNNFKNDLTALTAMVEFIKQIESGKWKIINNQMIFYKDDNSTELFRCNLYDENGNPTVEGVMERRRA